MIELIDKGSNKKLMALVMCGIKYRELSYLVYSIRREEEDANIFVSRLVSNSEGYTIISNFDNGEKEILEGVVKKIINKTSVEELESDGFSIISDVSLIGVNYFDVKKSYVSTIPRILVKSVMEYYDLIKDSDRVVPVIDVADDKKYNEGFVSNILLIVFGVFLLIFCVGVIYEVFRG